MSLRTPNQLLGLGTKIRSFRAGARRRKATCVPTPPPIAPESPNIAGHAAAFQQTFDLGRRRSGRPPRESQFQVMQERRIGADIQSGKCIERRGGAGPASATPPTPDRQSCPDNRHQRNFQRPFPLRRQTGRSFNVKEPLVERLGRVPSDRGDGNG